MTEGFLFLQAVRRQWRLALLVVVPLVVGATLYAETAPAQYDATAVIGFSPRSDREPSSDIIRLVLPKYTVFLTAPQTLRQVADATGLRRGELEDGVDPSIPAETATLRIRFRHTSPDAAAEAANELAEAAIDYAAADPIVEADLITAAVVPGDPAAPPRRLIEAASLLMAVLLGAGTALLAERARPRVRSLADITAVTGLRVVGRLPFRRSLRGRPLDALADPVVGNAIRSSRTAIDRESREFPVHVLTVTSPSQADGKSTFSALFAATLARLDARVLLVDGDLVRPRLARRFDVPDAPGLGPVLRKEASLEDSVVEVLPRLWLLPAVPEHEAGDLVARRFGELLSEARSTFDVIVVDAPPVLGSDMSATLATFAEAVVFVVSAGSLTTSVRQALTTLETMSVRVLGVVANGFREPNESYYIGDPRR